MNTTLPLQPTQVKRIRINHRPRWLVALLLVATLAIATPTATA